MDGRKNFYESVQALAEAAQGGGEVTVPAGVEMFRCCTEGHGLVGNTGAKWMVELDDLRDLFRP